MPSGQQAVRIKLSLRQEAQLKKYKNKRTISMQEKQRIEIILYSSSGKTNTLISEQLNLNQNTVAKWRNRWSESMEQLEEYEQEEVSDAELLNRMLAILSDSPRSGTPTRISMQEKQHIVALACRSPEEFGLPMTQWNREMLAHVAMSEAMVKKISPRYVSEVLKKTS